MRSSVSLPAERFAADDDSASVLTEPTSRYLIAPAMDESYVDPKIWNYGHGLFNSFSVYAHTCGLNFSTQKSLLELFEDIDRYTFEPHRGALFEEYALFTDDVSLPETQVWTTRTYTLAETPDASLPYFPRRGLRRLIRWRILLHGTSLRAWQAILSKGIFLRTP